MAYNQDKMTSDEYETLINACDHTFSQIYHSAAFQQATVHY